MTDPTDDDRRDPPPADGAARRRAEGSELEEGVEHLGRVIGSVATRLFGEKVTGRALDPDKPAISTDADAAIDEFGDNLGRLLHATGRALKQHPVAPKKAVDDVRQHAADPVATDDGEAPLTAGLRALAEGVYQSTNPCWTAWRRAPQAPRRSRPWPHRAFSSPEPTPRSARPW